MGIISELNSPIMYLIVGVVVAFVALVCVVFMVRAYKAGIDIGMDKYKLKQTITSSATFAILPSVGILLGVIALAGSLGIPLPWLRLSVIGALHYETQVAEAAAESVGLPGLSATYMTREAFVTIALVMSVCIIWGMVFSIFFTKKYTGGSKKEKKDKKKSVFATLFQQKIHLKASRRIKERRPCGGIWRQGHDSHVHRIGQRLYRKLYRLLCLVSGDFHL